MYLMLQFYHTLQERDNVFLDVAYQVGNYHSNTNHFILMCYCSVKQIVVDNR